MSKVFEAYLFEKHKLEYYKIKCRKCITVQFLTKPLTLVLNSSLSRLAGKNGFPAVYPLKKIYWIKIWKKLLFKI